MMNLKCLVICLLVVQVFSNQWKYTLAQEWPGSVCRTNKCTVQDIIDFDGTGWNLHGVWPDKQNLQICKSIFTCSHESYDPQVLSQSTQEDLDKYWVGLYNSADTFRSHEWSKHGTCWQGPALQSTGNTQESYFRTGLALRRSYNLYQSLHNAGIIPHNTITYKFQSVVSAILNTMATVSGGNSLHEDMIEIQCSNDSQTGHAMITQVYLCLNEDYQPMNCNCNNGQEHRVSNSCNSDILYPTFARL